MLKRTCRQKGSRRLHRNMQVYIPTLTFSVPWLNLHREQGVKFAKVQFRTSGGNRNFVWVWTVGRSGEKETIKNDSSRKSRFEISRSSSRLCQTHVNKDLKQAICAICNFATGTRNSRNQARNDGTNRRNLSGTSQRCPSIGRHGRTADMGLKEA